MRRLALLVLMAAMLTLTSCVGPAAGGSDTSDPEVFDPEPQSTFMR